MVNGSTNGYGGFMMTLQEVLKSVDNLRDKSPGGEVNL